MLDVRPNVLDKVEVGRVGGSGTYSDVFLLKEPMTLRAV